MRQPNYPSGQGDSLNEPSYDTDDIAEQELCEYDAEYLYGLSAGRPINFTPHDQAAAKFLRSLFAALPERLPA